VTRADVSATPAAPINVGETSQSGIAKMLELLRGGTRAAAGSEISSGSATPETFGTPATSPTGDPRLHVGEDRDTEIPMSFISQMDEPMECTTSGTSTGRDDTTDESIASSNSTLDTRVDESTKQRSREADIKFLGSFIRTVCQLVPLGELMWTVYWEFITRLGITRIEKLRKLLRSDDREFSGRFPNWFAHYATEMIDEFIASRPKVDSPSSLADGSMSTEKSAL
jgi:hypothetical protein